jgi:hypothetical protein
MPLTKVQIGMTDAPVSGTAVTASGTSVDFTGIPSTAKRITVMFSQVSTSGASRVQIQIGSGSFITSGYAGTVSETSNSGQAAIVNSSGFFTEASATASAATSIRHGSVQLSNITGNTWAISGNFGLSNVAIGFCLSGSLGLSGILDRVRITTVNGTDTFDAGTINILVE